MKRILLTIGVLLLAGAAASAQDLITKNDGTDIKAKIIEVNPGDVKYKQWNNQDGPTFTINKSDILMITYQNGDREIMSQQQAAPVTTQPARPATTSSSRQPAQEIDKGQKLYATNVNKIEPGLKYHQLKKIYDRSDYTGSEPGDRYKPAFGWLGLVYPGIPQFIMGEGGLGARYLVFGIISDSMIYTGSRLAVSTGDQEWLLMSLGGGIMLTIDAIVSAVNGSRAAKVKNLYERDLKTLGMSRYSFNVSPYVAPVYMGGEYQPAMGFTLSMNF